MNPLEWVIGYQPTNQPTNNIGEIQMFSEQILEGEKQDLVEPPHQRCHQTNLFETNFTH